MVAIVLAGPMRARADDNKPWAAGVSEAEQKTALVIYKQGNVEFEESRYAQALAKYREALRHWDHPAIHFNMAALAASRSGAARTAGMTRKSS